MDYHIDSLTIDQLRELIRTGDDSHHNQLRIRDSGEIFLSQAVGNQALNGIRGRFETFDARNGYVGSAAADDDEFISRLFAAIQSWRQNSHPSTYIDLW